MLGEVCGPEGGGAKGRGAAAGASVARTRTTRDWGAVWAEHARGGAHVEHAFNVRDTGRVEVQRLIEGLRALPRSRAGRVMLGEVCGPEGGGAKGRGAAAGAGGAHADDPRLEG